MNNWHFVHSCAARLSPLNIGRSLPQPANGGFLACNPMCSSTAFGRSETVAGRLIPNAYSRPKRAGGERQVPGNPIRLWASYPRIYRFYVLA